MLVLGAVKAPLVERESAAAVMKREEDFMVQNVGVVLLLAPLLKTKNWRKVSLSQQSEGKKRVVSRYRSITTISKH